MPFMKEPFIFNIQKYSIHDGDGIRTTVFFKGCPLRCGWCHNPESQDFNPELLYAAGKCTGCSECVSVCPWGANRIENGKAVFDRERCSHCGRCVEVCLGQARELAGKCWPLESLIAELEKDRAFYEESHGGVTLSGGEVMAQPMDYVEALTRALFERGISVFIDTCGDVPYERFGRILPYVDTFLYDLKAMSAKKHRKFIGTDNLRILENLRRLSDAGARIYLRLPLIAGVNMEREDLQAIWEFLQGGVRVARISLLPYHSIGRNKYDRLGRDYDPGGIFGIPMREKMERAAELFRQNGFHEIEIGG